MTSSRFWPSAARAIKPRLDADDDPRAWDAIGNHVLADAERLLVAAPRSLDVILHVGRCSHWLRPHQTRWTADGGFAWPSGYGGTGQSRLGLPEFDWSVAVHLTYRDGPIPTRRDCLSGFSSRKLLFRVAIPSRTARHDQAAVHTIWTPGTPQQRRQRFMQFYGFRRTEKGWEPRAYHAEPEEGPYELAAMELGHGAART